MVLCELPREAYPAFQSRGSGDPANHIDPLGLDDGPDCPPNKNVVLDANNRPMKDANANFICISSTGGDTTTADPDPNPGVEVHAMVDVDWGAIQADVRDLVMGMELLGVGLSATANGLWTAGKAYSQWEVQGVRNLQQDPQNCVRRPSITPQVFALSAGAPLRG